MNPSAACPGELTEREDQHRRMTRRSDLPPALRSGGFTVVGARAAGVSRSRLRAKDLIPATRGARLHREHTFTERCSAVMAVLDDRVFATGRTAAMLHGLPLPHGLRDCLELGIPAPARAVRRRGVTARSLRIEESELTVVRDIRTTSIARTWCELARTLTVPALVAAGDEAVRKVGADRLAAAARRHPDRRLHARLGAALELLDPRSESPKESELRALIVLAGLPGPVPNVTLRNAAGRFVARVDLLIEEFEEVLEYHGDHHRTNLLQWRRDRTRESEIESLGYHVTEVTQADLDQPERLIRRLEATLRRKGWSATPTRSRWFPRREAVSGQTLRVKGPPHPQQPS